MLDRTYEVKGGTLTVKVEYAEEKEEHQENRGRIKVYHPTLNVEGKTTIRGREYTIRGDWQWKTWEDRRGAEHEGWHPSWQPYDGRYKKDTGGSVPWDTATYKDLDRVVGECLTEYAHEVPNWRDVSLAMAHKSLVDRMANQVRDLTEKLNEAVASEAALRSKYASHLKLIESL